MRAKVHKYGGLALYVENAAKAVLVVRHQITPFVGLDRFLNDGDIKGASRQGASPEASALR